MELEDALSSNDSEIYFASASCGPGRRVSIGDCFWSSLSKAGRCFLLRLEALYIPVQRRLRQDRAISRMASVSVFYPTSYVSRDANYGLKLKRVNAPISASGVVCVGFHRVFQPPVDFEVLRHPKPLTLTLEDFFKCISPEANGNGSGNWADQGFSLPDFLASSSHGKRDSRSKANILVMSVSSFNRLQRYSAAHRLYGWSREQVLGYIGDGCLAQCPTGTKVFFCRRKHPLYHVNRHANRQESLAPKRKGELRTLGRRSEQECISDLQLRVRVDRRCLRRQRSGGVGNDNEADSDRDEVGGRAGRGRPKRTRYAVAVAAAAATDRLSSSRSSATPAAAKQQQRKKPPSTAAARAAAVAAAAAAPSRKRRIGRRKKGRPPKKRPKLEQATPPKLEVSDVSPPSPPAPTSPQSPVSSPQPSLPPPPQPLPSVPLPLHQQQLVKQQPLPHLQSLFPQSTPVAASLPRKRGRPRKSAQLETPTLRREVANEPSTVPVVDATVEKVEAKSTMSIDASATTAPPSIATVDATVSDASAARDSIDCVIENVLSQAHTQERKPPSLPSMPSPPSHRPPRSSSPFQLRLETISPAAPVTKFENEPVSPAPVSQQEFYQLNSFHNHMQQQQQQQHQQQQQRLTPHNYHHLFQQHPHPLMHLPFFPPTSGDEAAAAAFLQQLASRHHQAASWEAAAAAAASVSLPSLPPPFPPPPQMQFPPHQQHFLQQHQQQHYHQQQQQQQQQQQKPDGPLPQSMWVPQKTPCYGAPPLHMPGSFPGLSAHAAAAAAAAAAAGIPFRPQHFGGPLQSLPSFLQPPAATLVPVIIANPMAGPAASLPHSSGPPPASSAAGGAPPTSSAAAAVGVSPSARFPPHPGLFLPQLNVYHGDA